METKLSEKQELFCQLYPLCLNAAQAARDAGYSVDTARQMGYENLTKPHIKARIEAIQREMYAENKASIEQSMQRIRAIQRKALMENNLSVALHAEKLVAQHLGAFIQRMEVDVKDPDTEELREYRSIERARRVVFLLHKAKQSSSEEVIEH